MCKLMFLVVAVLLMGAQQESCDDPPKPPMKAKECVEICEPLPVKTFKPKWYRPNDLSEVCTCGVQVNTIKTESE